MIEFETTIQAKSAPNGVARILAWKWSDDDFLCCHPEYDPDRSSVAPAAWTITHIATGLSVTPSRVTDKHAAMLLIAEYEQLPGWDKPDRELSSKVEDAYEKFWERITPRLTVTEYRDDHAQA